MVVSYAVPTDFVASAKKLGISKFIATEFYIRKTHKKGFDDLRAKLAYEEGFKSEAEAAQLLSSLWKSYKNKDVFGLGGSPAVQTKEKINSQTYLEAAREGLEELIGKLGSAKSKPFSKSKVRRQVIASDSHIPFVSKKSIQALFECGAQDIFFVGDLNDQYASSRFRTELDYITAREELAQGRAFVEELSKRFENVYMLKSSNHDMRPLRRMQELFPQLLPLIVNPIELICQGLPNVTMLSTEIPGTAPHVKFGSDYEVGYLSQHGDKVFSHMENFCGSDGVNKVDAWLKQWAHVLPYKGGTKAIFHAHVHRLSLEYSPSGVALIQTGCLCQPQPYQIDGHGKYNPPTPGFVLLDEIDGQTDLNSIQMVYTG